MRLQKQLFRHDPTNEIWGDCFRTCIAIILDLDAADVPHFLDCTATPDQADRDRHEKEWLASQGFVIIRVPVDGSAELESVLMMAGQASPMPYILSGMSRTPANHCVVCQGDQIVCDPSLTDSGIVGPMDSGQYWVEWLVRAP